MPNRRHFLACVLPIFAVGACTLTHPNAVQGPPPSGIVLAVIGDTQNNIEPEQTGGSPANVRAQAEYAVSIGAEIVILTGDIVNGGCGSAGWQVIGWALEPIRAAGIPMISCVGNHDVGPVGGGHPDSSSAEYNKHIGPDSDVRFFAAKGHKFVVVSIRYDPNLVHPEWMAWADSVFEAHPDRNGIMLSHALLSSGDRGPEDWPSNWYGQGFPLWQQLRDNKNVFLMLTGHHDAEGFRADTFGGRSIYTIMSNYQFRSDGGSGWMRLYELHPDKHRIDVSTYNAVTGEWEQDSNSWYTLSWTPVPRGSGRTKRLPAEVR